MLLTILSKTMRHNIRDVNLLMFLTLLRRLQVRMRFREKELANAV